MPAPMRNEKNVKAAIKKLLDQHGWFWWMPPANGYGKVGISDIQALKDGVFLSIEAKFGSNGPTPHQSAFLTSINSESAFGFVVNDSNLEWLEVFLKNFGEQVREASVNKQMNNEAGALLLDAIRALQMLI